MRHKINVNRLTAAFAAAIAAAAVLASSVVAQAAVLPAETIDGPSASIIDLGGVAMAEDGTGGVVYRKIEQDRSHIFAARFDGTRWHAPQRVDTGQLFAGSWPVIAAANGGRLVVVWASEFGPSSDRLFAATQGPGAKRFQAPVPIDLDIEEASAVYPSIAMSRSGVAYLAYRIVSDPGPNPLLPEGYVGADIRLARFNGWTWSSLGRVADRNPAVAVRRPSDTNQAKVGVDRNGNGIVVFQEPDEQMIDRIWARRIFGSNLGRVLPVSPAEWNGQPLQGHADSFAVAQAGFGQAVVAFVQQPGEPPAWPGPRMMVNTIAESSNSEAASFAGARIADDFGDGSFAAGSPTVGIDARGSFALGFAAGSATMGAMADQRSISIPTRLDDGSSLLDPHPQVSVGLSGRGTWAWRGGDETTGVVMVREGSGHLPDTAGEPVAAAMGGPITRLLTAGSGLGDTAIAFEQGGPAFAQIAVAITDAPPGAFGLHLPDEWVRGDSFALTWDSAPSALGKVTYTIEIDAKAVARSESTAVRLDRKFLTSGRRGVKVIATDRVGQKTETEVGELKIDRSGPVARIRSSRKQSAVVRLTDKLSGMTQSAVIRWGDGTRQRSVRSTARHRYKRPGRYLIVITARDAAGNQSRIRRSISVR